MNKIVVDKEKVDANVDDAIETIYIPKKSLFDITTISLNIKDNTNLFLNVNSNNTKLKININVSKNILFNLNIETKGSNGKIRYHYDIDEFSSVNVLKYNSVDKINEMVEVNLNGAYSKIDYLFKSISNNKESYDYMILHNAKNTESNIRNHGVNINSSMIVQVATTVPKNIIDCKCNQFNRIINLTNNKCEIRPILYIDNDLVDANHSALIGDFEEDELFYLESRGISKKEAYNLLTRGFLLSGVEDETIKKDIEDDLNKYWR